MKDIVFLCIKSVLGELVWGLAFSGYSTLKSESHKTWSEQADAPSNPLEGMKTVGPMCCRYVIIDV